MQLIEKVCKKKNKIKNKFLKPIPYGESGRGILLFCLLNIVFKLPN